tara:strand:+ start:32509 stop:38487 length:5979 start_codon:yes stop_codon:yes gene_type:complete
MIHRIKTSRSSKFIASFLSVLLITTVVEPTATYALTSGPSQPEFNSFTPIGTSDMVNLSSGDFNYNIPIMDVGGYPLNLAYDSGIGMDQEASWVGLGWNLNVGQINRDVRGIPDDFKGDGMVYENDMKDNITVGSNFGIQGSVFGFPGEIGLNLGLGVQYNNYQGITFHPSYGVSFGIHDNVQVGMNISSSTADGATVSPSVSFTANIDDKEKEQITSITGGVGLSLSSRKGLGSLSMSASASQTKYMSLRILNSPLFQIPTGKKSLGGASGVISLNNNNLYTPFKRAGTVSGNFSFNAAIGTEVLGIEGQGHIMGYGSYQKIRSEEKNKTVPAFGYDYSEFANKGNSILDFNRENDRSFNKNTTVLPIANHTYDIYSLQGQGISGMFRPHRGQVSYLVDNKVSDYGDGASAGIEFGLGWNVHTGADIKISPSYSYTGGWFDQNYTINHFGESNTDTNSLKYEPVYFSMVGEMNVDSEPSLYYDKIKDSKPIKIGIGGNNWSHTLLPNFVVKDYDIDGLPIQTTVPISSKIKRDDRNKRNTAIYKVTSGEASNDPFVTSRDIEHHTAGIKILKPDGSTYVYGETAYNLTKEAITVDVSGTSDANCATGLIQNNGTVNAGNNSDRYKNIIKTPAYAHTFLLSSILSNDYEDISGDGPSIDDLGSFTLFNYGKLGDQSHYVENYNWRIPFEEGKASYNEGLKSLNNDQKASIIKGTKELRYLKTIQTKTHVAYFKLSDRKDAKSSSGNAQMKKINKIFLFTLAEYNQLLSENGGNIDAINETLLSKSAIKTAHFIYDYGLCLGIPNNNLSTVLTENELANQFGKLTLKKLYFTYRGSNMGMFTPYKFNYDGFNPSYNLKGHDIWGNYKENLAQGCGISQPLSTSEFPFVEQNKESADMNASAWMLTSIDLPSGGKLEIETEADDHQFVQNKKAMQMFKIHGFSTDGSNPAASSNTLYNGNDHTNYIHVKISDEVLSPYSGQDFLNDYLKENAYKPIYFRALLNMFKNTTTQYDYVSGYFEIDPGSDNVITGNDFTIATNANGTYVTIPMKMLEKEGGFINSNDQVNPIAKAGWYFGRTHLNRVVYSLGGNATNTSFISIVEDLVSSLGAVFEIFSGPNGKLQEKQIARNLILDKSWVRLENPTGRKFGGGARVKTLQLHDQWNVMTNNIENSLYKQFYGQEYNYDLDDGTSSGVAAYEPNGSAENPFVEPFYDNAGNAKDRLVAPKESNYSEKPFGESFFPAATVTYGRVTVKNLDRVDGDNIVKQNATGKVVTEFYTTKDFPTLTDYTDITPLYSPPSPLNNILNLNVRNHLAFSQGFVVETNDINGRIKSQRVYPEGQDTYISGVDYIYNTTEDDKISSTVTTIDKDGTVNDETEVGLIYDLYNDFRENYSESTTLGFEFNIAGFVIFIVPVVVPLPIPTYAYHETKLRTASTTKVIHRTAILKETIAYDLGSKVSTKNLAWDAHTGNVLLTETINEYDDYYYSFNYPSHWYYKGMDMATTNIGVKGQLLKNEDQHSFNLSGQHSGQNLREVFFPGDELNVNEGQDFYKLWVVKVEDDNLVLMKRDGYIINHLCEEIDLDFNITRSGFRNMQPSSMASVTSMLNPINLNGDETLDNIDADTFIFSESSQTNPKIVNSSAVAYSEAWALQWENNLPKFPHHLIGSFDDIFYGETIHQSTEIDPYSYGFNPYLYNVRGLWRAKKSYAYLTGRASNITGEASPRYEGFFNKFHPFYHIDETQQNKWKITEENWTFASQVSQYSPYGPEIENKDALNRYSTAQYGYNYSLPVAVASNSQYNEIGFDGFEDFYFLNQDGVNDPHFGFFAPNNSSVALTTETSHTGRTSIVVTGQASLEINFEDCSYVAPEYEDPACGDDPPPPCQNLDFTVITAVMNQTTSTFEAVIEIVGSVDMDLLLDENNNCGLLIDDHPNYSTEVEWGIPDPGGDLRILYSVVCHTPPVGGVECFVIPDSAKFALWHAGGETCCPREVDLTIN